MKEKEYIGSDFTHSHTGKFLITFIGVISLIATLFIPLKSYSLNRLNTEKSSEVSNTANQLSDSKTVQNQVEQNGGENASNSVKMNENGTKATVNNTAKTTANNQTEPNETNTDNIIIRIENPGNGNFTIYNKWNSTIYVGTTSDTLQSVSASGNKPFSSLTISDEVIVSPSDDNSFRNWSYIYAGLIIRGASNNEEQQKL
jgi:hypothetical protein